MEETLLVVHRLSRTRKSLVRHLESRGERVLGLDTLGSALPRVRTRRYELLLCTDPPTGSRWVEDYARIVTPDGMLARTLGYELWKPASGLHCDVIVIVPGADPEAMDAAIRDARARHARARSATTAPGSGSHERATPRTG